MSSNKRIDEQSYEEGSRAVWTKILRLCCRELGYGSHYNWIVEREETIKLLREVCGKYGDNDWGRGLHLSDIIENHLYRNLDNTIGE